LRCRMRYYLDFEKKLEPFEKRIDEIKRFYDVNDPHYSKELSTIAKKILKLEKEIYGELTNWQRLQISRHVNRPHTLDYVDRLFKDFVELKGDRAYRDDPAIVAGFAFFEGTKVAVIGHQKGKNIREMAYHNFGMAHPDGYRKAMRIMGLANRWGKPIITFVDTPGAFPGIEAEERGQAEAIASSIFLMFSLNVPIITVVIGEGGSGGALAISVGDRIIMLENATYSVISPEGCAAILWRDGSKGPLAADAMKPTARDLLRSRVIEEVIKEPFGGAHRNWEETFLSTKTSIAAHLTRLVQIPVEELKEQRYKKFRSLGVFEEHK
jgi:acetyl-CoA carboxylase carboxyl transferase subunit alpha